MAISITNVENLIDLTRNDHYFAMTVEQRIEFLTEAQQLLASLLNAELDVFSDQLAAEIDNAKHSQ